MYKVLDKCMCCDGTNLYKYLDLGEQPLANSYRLNKDDVENKYPLYLNVCKDCWHSQNGIAVDPQEMFKDYLYVSSSGAMREYFNDLAKEIWKDAAMKKSSILDIACNDGSFVNIFKRYGWDVYGIDPAENINKEFIQGYFPKDFNKEIKFDVITALNVFGHIPNPYEFLVKCKEILNDDGLLYIQTSQKDMIVNGEFDTVYHEHHSFFSVKSMKTLCERVGLYIHYVQSKDVHGNSYLFTISKKEGFPGAIGELQREEEEGRYALELYEDFQYKVEDIKNQLSDLCITEPVIGYGAPAKAVVLINAFKIDLEYIIDDSPLKQGRYIPGTNIKIYDRNKLKEDKRNLVIMALAWNMFDDIKRNVSSVRENNNKFIKVFPFLEVVNG